MTEKHAFYIEHDVYERINALYKTQGYKCLGDLVNAALMDWLAKDAGDFVSGYLKKELREELHNNENYLLRINHMLFRMAVCITELQHVLVSGYKRIDKDFTKRVRDISIREVRVLNGIMNLCDFINEEDLRSSGFLGEPVMKDDDNYS